MSVLNENISQRKKWCVETVSLEPEGEFLLGIRKEHVALLKKELASEKYYQQVRESGAFTLEHLKATIRLLKDKKLFQPDLATAVMDLLADKIAIENKQPTNLDTDKELQRETEPIDLNRELQQLLLRFQSPDPPFTVQVDNIWGPLTQKAVDFVLDAYNLTRQGPSIELAATLLTIADRIIRIRCKNERIIESVLYNPFCIIREEATEYELVREHKHAKFIRLVDKKELVRFTGLVEKSEAGQLAFNAFSAWFLLLTMGNDKKGLEKLSPVQFSTIEGQWLPLHEMTAKPGSAGSMIDADLTIELSNTTPGFPFKINTTEGVSIIAIALSKGLEIGVLHYQVNTHAFGFGDFFEDRPESNIPEIIHQHNADYIKLFAVKTNRRNKLRPVIENKIRGIDASAILYDLVTINEEDILATSLIAVSKLPEMALIPNFRAYIKKLYAKTTVKVPDDLQKNRWGGKVANKGKLIRAEVKKKGRYNFSIELSVVSIDENAPLQGDVVFFLHDTFQKDEVIFTEVKHGSAELAIEAYEAFTVGACTQDGTLLEMDLQLEKGFPQGFYYDQESGDLRKRVEKLLDERPITVRGDLQKNRWGRKNYVNDKRLTASVEISSVPGYFKVVVAVRAGNAERKLEGEVAFFLHDTFEREVRYKKVIDGEAKITFRAYEAFTLGALTQDGTMLELDLNEQAGYPEQFYYGKGKKRTKKK